MMQRNFYQVLGVNPDAASTEIRAAFVRLSKRHHPDLAGDHDDLPWRVQEVQQAYRCLSDPDARAAHDRALRESERLHFARQRAVRRRLNRYDRRHPHAQPRPYRRNRWRILAMISLGAVIVAHLSLRLIG